MYSVADDKSDHSSGGLPVMNKITTFLKSHPALYYLVVFLLMIIPALLLFPAAEGENQIGLIVFLGLVILANLAAVFPFNSK
jgi:hypothetical protein